MEELTEWTSSENWERNQEGWFSWAHRFLTQSGYDPVENFMVPRFKEMVARIKAVVSENATIHNIIQAAQARGGAGYTAAEGNTLAASAGKIQGHFGGLMTAMKDWTEDTTLPGDVPANILPQGQEQASTIDMPFMDIFTLADDFNTPFVGILRTSFVLDAAKQKSDGIIAVENALKKNMDYHEIPTRIKLKLNEAMLQASETTEGQIHALEGYISNSRANLAEGGYIPADIYKEPGLDIAVTMKHSLSQIRRQSQRIGALPATVGFPTHQEIAGGTAVTQPQQDVILYLQRWCNQGRGVAARGPLMVQKLRELEDHLKNIADGNGVIGNTSSYNEKVRKLIKYITISIPNNMPMRRAEFIADAGSLAASAAEDGKQFALNALDPNAMEVDAPLNDEAINQAYNEYLTAWQGSIWRTRQSINGTDAVDEDGNTGILGLLQEEIAVVNPPIPNDTMENNLLSVFPFIPQAQGQGPTTINSVGWNEGVGQNLVYKSIYRTSVSTGAALTITSGQNTFTIGGKRKKSRRKSRKRKQKGGKRKAKKRKSRKKRGGAGCKSKKDCGGNKLCLPGGTQNIKDGPGECVPKPVFVSHMKVRGQEKKDARAAAKEAATAAPQVDTSALTPAVVEEKTPVEIPAVETPAVETPAESLLPKSCANKSECDAGQICFGKKGSKVCGSVDDAKAAGKAKTDARVTAKEVAKSEPQVDTSALTPAVEPTVEPTVETPASIETGYSTKDMTEAQKEQMKIIAGMTEEQLTAKVEQIYLNAQKDIPAPASVAAGGYKKKRKKRRKKRKTKRKNKSKKNKSKKHKKRY